MEFIQTPEKRRLQSQKASVFLLGNKNRLGYKDPREIIEKKTAHLKGNQHKKGKPDSLETRLRKSEAVKGIPKSRVDCPMCGKSVTPNTFKRHLATH